MECWKLEVENFRKLRLIEFGKTFTAFLGKNLSPSAACKDAQIVKQFCYFMAFNSRGCPIRSPSLTIIKQVSGSCISLYPHLSRTDFILASFFHLPCYLPRIFVSAPKEGAASALGVMLPHIVLFSGSSPAHNSFALQPTSLLRSRQRSRSLHQDLVARAKKFFVHVDVKNYISGNWFALNAF